MPCLVLISQSTNSSPNSVLSSLATGTQHGDANQARLLAIHMCYPYSIMLLKKHTFQPYCMRLSWVFVQLSLIVLLTSIC